MRLSHDSKVPLPLPLSFLVCLSVQIILVLGNPVLPVAGDLKSRNYDTLFNGLDSRAVEVASPDLEPPGLYKRQCTLTNQENQEWQVQVFMRRQARHHATNT